jgi:hypothetical protein
MNDQVEIFMKGEVVSVFKILSEKNSKGTEKTRCKYQLYILTNLIVLLQGWPVWVVMHF